MLAFDYLPQKGVMTSKQFIPPADELPEFWMAKFLPFNFPGIPSWGNEQLTINVQKRFLLTAVNLAFTASFPFGYVQAVTVATPGAGLVPGVYVLEGRNENPFNHPTVTAVITVTVNADGTVHPDGVILTNPGAGYGSTAPFFVMPPAVDNATFTVQMVNAGLGPWTGQPTIQIYQNHHKVQLQLLQKSLFAPNIFGSGGNPGYLKTPYLFDANDQITVECSYTSVFPGFQGASNLNPDYLYCFLTMIGGEPLG